ncbi:MAG: AAA family ATPase [Maledivibacter sp.]|nr:AAA family ATPase [Maledivibacter sp.]
MSKIHLIIADKDEAYVDSLSDYLISKHSNRFQVNAFTKREYLSEYISQNKGKADILLLCSEWYTGCDFMDEVNTTIILSGGMLTNEVMDCEVINKYQRGDKLVGSILNCFAEVNPNKYYISDKDKKTKMIAVYSPLGGVGKTSIALGASIKSAEDGKAVFYLNLENIQSTSNFFDCKNSQSISNLIYYIKENKKNIALKIEGIRCVDSMYNIHYFSPPDSCVDLNEMSIDEMQYLLNKLRLSKDYDEIYIDMSSNLDEKNISILNSSDQIILVIDQDDMSMVKINRFLTELKLLSKRNDMNILSKIILVLNKYNENEYINIKSGELDGMTVSVKIPYIFKPISTYEGNYRKDMKVEFKNAIAKILKVIE